MQHDRSDTPVPGDLIWIRRRQWRVRSTHAGAGIVRVIVDGQAANESRSFLLPCDRWAPDQSRQHRTVSPPRALAWLAALTSRVHPAWTPGSVIESRTEILAYQLEPALAVLSGRRRILIADDVGLGKTIQAALIVAETIRRSPDARILVIAPTSLLTQWASELRDRFGVAARTADADTFTRLRADRPYLSNPWRSPGVWLTSPDYLKQPHVLEAIPASPLELVVIDEAHILAGNSQRHSAVNTLARPARNVVLLTATPHDGDSIRFNRLVSLAATGSQADALTIFRRARTNAVRHLRRLDVAPGVRLSRVLAGIDSFERARQGGASSDGLALICGVFRKRALSSLPALRASLERRLAIVTAASTPASEENWSQLGLTFGDELADGPDDGDVMSSDEWRAMTMVTGLTRARERSWLERLLNLASVTSAPSSRGDPKLDRLTSLLRRASEPVVVFTEYRDSLLAMADAVAASRRVAILHGGLAASEQRRALAAFLEGRADALLATDVASQGLNLQHRARWVVHFDLPWTPMRLEQRVGRVDRIGQTRTVHVTSIGIRHQAQEALRQRVARREEVRDRLALTGCRRWTGAAEGLARLFTRQRALASRWRGPDPVAVPRARVTAAVIRRICGRDCCSPVVLFEIPIVVGAGNVIERHLGFRCVNEENGDSNVSLALQSRARALTSRAQRRLARQAAAHAIDERGTPTQPGLFEARDLNGSAAEASREDSPSSPALDVALRVGEPRPILILERRR